MVNIGAGLRKRQYREHEENNAQALRRFTLTSGEHQKTSHQTELLLLLFMPIILEFQGINTLFF